MQLHPLTPHVWVTDPQPETDRPTLGYIRGTTAALAIDAGNSPAHLQAFYRLLEEASLPLPQLTVLTHWHWDHTFALCALPGPSLCGSATQQKLLQVSRWQWDEASVARRLASGEEIPFCDTHQRAEYGSLSAIQVRPATFAFSGSLVLDLGGVHCRLWETDSPHTRDSVLALVPEDGVLFLGDADCGDFYENQGRCDPGRLEAFTRQLQALEFSLAVPGHDRPLSRLEEFSCLQGTGRRGLLAAPSYPPQTAQSSPFRPKMPKNTPAGTGGIYAEQGFSQKSRADAGVCGSLAV